MNWKWNWDGIGLAIGSELIDWEKGNWLIRLGQWGMVLILFHIWNRDLIERAFISSFFNTAFPNQLIPYQLNRMCNVMLLQAHFTFWWNLCMTGEFTGVMTCHQAWCKACEGGGHGPYGGTALLYTASYTDQEKWPVNHRPYSSANTPCGCKYLDHKLLQFTCLITFFVTMSISSWQSHLSV